MLIWFGEFSGKCILIGFVKPNLNLICIYVFPTAFITDFITCLLVQNNLLHLLSIHNSYFVAF